MTILLDPKTIRAKAISGLTDQRAEPIPGWALGQIKLPEGESATGTDQKIERAGVFRRAQNIMSARRLRRVITESDPHALSCEQMWILCAAQMGKTINIVYALAAWMAVHFPAIPMALVWPSIDVRRMQMKGRLEPLFQESPALAGLMPDPEAELYSRRIGDRLWRLNNGARLRLLVGNIANDCRSNPMAILGLDEFDALDQDVGHQGNPISLLVGRQRTFGVDRLCVGVTTPTLVDGHGWSRLCDGSHERLMIICEKCGAADWLNPDRLITIDGIDDPKLIRRRDSARWVCQWCQTQYATAGIRRLVRAAWEADRWAAGLWEVSDDHPRGLWTPALETDAAGRPVGAWPIVDGIVRSQHLNLLYSSTYKAGEFLADERAALAGHEVDRQAHWNTNRAEPWFPTAPDPVGDEGRNAIIALTRPKGQVPLAAKWLILIIDQQGNTEHLCWFPWVLRAYAPGGESWLVDCGKVERGGGDTPTGWVAIGILCARTWEGADGKQWSPHLCAMDNANGNMSLRIRTWAAQDPSKRICVWGAPKLGHEEPYRVYVPGKRAKVPLPVGVRAYEINPTHWRDRVDERRRQMPGQVGWWLCDGPPAYYLRSLWDSEQRVLKQRRITGMGIRDVVAWEPTQQIDSHGNVSLRKDNHWWDCEVMAAAIAHIFGIDKSPIPSASPPKTGHVVRAPSLIERRRTTITRRSLRGR